MPQPSILTGLVLPGIGGGTRAVRELLRRSGMSFQSTIPVLYGLSSFCWELVSWGASLSFTVQPYIRRYNLFILIGAALWWETGFTRITCCSAEWDLLPLLLKYVLE